VVEQGGSATRVAVDGGEVQRKPAVLSGHVHARTVRRQEAHLSYDYYVCMGWEEIHD